MVFLIQKTSASEFSLIECRLCSKNALNKCKITKGYLSFLRPSTYPTPTVRPMASW